MIKLFGLTRCKSQPAIHAFVPQIRSAKVRDRILRHQDEMSCWHSVNIQLSTHEFLKSCTFTQTACGEIVRAETSYIFFVLLQQFGRNNLQRTETAPHMFILLWREYAIIAT